jgi:hypothetical protein
LIYPILTYGRIKTQTIWEIRRQILPPISG